LCGIHPINKQRSIATASGQYAGTDDRTSSVKPASTEQEKQGDLYASVTLPNVIVGTIGGGTHLPTAHECLAMLGCVGEGTARKFAEICAATILAGEISIMGALATGEFAAAHARYARRK
jgi:hydroxymethylglutaryl-CoA reductase (NADPH)